MQQELSKIVEVALEDYSHSDTCLMGKEWITLSIYDYSAKVSGFSDDIGKLELPIVETATTLRTDHYN